MTSPLSKLSNLGQRVIAGIIGAAIIINAIYWSMWSFLILFSLIALLSQWEFYSLLKKAGYKPMVGWGMLLGMCLIGSIFIDELESSPQIFIPIIIILSFLMFIGKLYDKNDKQPFINIGFTFLGIIYVAFTFYCFIESALLSGTYLFPIPLGILLMLWASDSGAYFAGKKFGKTKLFERISPKKTWEGSIGGLLLSMLVAFVLSIYFKQLPSWQWFALSAIIVVIGSYGDLVESMLKRSIHIKDSGSVIPGHGGFLDRFDGLLLAAPFIWVFLRLFQNI